MTTFLQNQERDRARDKDVGQIKAGEVIRLKIEIKKINDVTTHNAVNRIADNARIKDGLRNRAQARCTKDRSPLPNEKRENDKGKGGQRPDMALQKTPRAPPILNVSEVKEIGNNGNRRGALQQTRGQFFRHRISENEVNDNGKDDEKPPHRSVRSMSLWHSMHVKTNG